MINSILNIHPRRTFNRWNDLCTFCTVYSLHCQWPNYIDDDSAANISQCASNFPGDLGFLEGANVPSIRPVETRLAREVCSSWSTISHPMSSARPPSFMLARTSSKVCHRLARRGTFLTVSPDEDLINFGLDSDVWYACFAIMSRGSCD